MEWKEKREKYYTNGAPYRAPPCRWPSPPSDTSLSTPRPSLRPALPLSRRQRPVHRAMIASVNPSREGLYSTLLKLVLLLPKFRD
ncbi:hypothetical protein AAC387_Pa03g0317 [Persea americana]